MTDFIPLQSNLTPNPVFHLDRNAPAADLNGGAVQRIKASRDLITASTACASKASTSAT